MGAAKNARKARRKARRREDRKLVFDMESTGISSLTGAIDSARSKLLDFSGLQEAFADLFYDPNRRLHGRGSSGALSRQVSQALESRETLGGTGYFDDSYINRILEQKAAVAARASEIKGKPAGGTLKDVDFSSIEMRVLSAYADAQRASKRLWDDLDKKRTYEMMYGIDPAMKFEDLYLQKPILDEVDRVSPTGRMATHHPIPYYSLDRYGKVRS